MKMGNTVKSVKYVQDYTVAVVFGDGYAAEVDLQGMFADCPGTLVQELLDKRTFRKVSVLNDTLTFANGYDICPDVLRFYCERGGVVSQSETDAYFADLLAAPDAFSVSCVAEPRAEYRTCSKKQM